MPRRAATTLLAALLVATPAAASGEEPPQSGAGAPRLVVEQESLDIGVVEAGADAVATFVLRNDGERDLHILKAKPS